MAENEDTARLSDQEVIAKTAWGEARSLGSDGMQATINTGQNRVASGVHWWGTTLRSVFLYPYQYSCWLTGDPNRSKLLQVTESDPQYAIAMQLASAALSGSLPDITGGADSYYAISLPKPPKWAEGLSPCFEIGAHLYFRTVNLCGEHPQST